MWVRGSVRLALADRGTQIARQPHSHVIWTDRPLRGKAHTRMTLTVKTQAECHQVGIWLKAKLKLAEKFGVAAACFRGSQR